MQHERVEACRGCRPGQASECVIARDASEDAPAHVHRQVQWLAARYALSINQARLIAQHAFATMGRAGR